MAKAKPTTYQRWWSKKGAELANEVQKICTDLENDHSWRRTRHLESLRLYEGRNLEGLYAGAYSLSCEYSDLTYRLHQSLTETVQAKIAGRQKPRPMFLTSGGGFKARRRAKRLDKFVEAVLHQPQGRYLNGWELATDVFLDAAIWGVGAIKVFAEESRITLERVFPFELYCDPHEARYGTPLNLFHVYAADKDCLIAEFAEDDEELKAAIEGADTIDDDDEIYGGAGGRLSQMVKVYECWRLPISQAQPGRHALVINGHVLNGEKDAETGERSGEEWTRPDFPFVFMRWSPDRVGFWAKGLVEEAESQVEEINTMAQKLQQRMRVCSGKRTYVAQGSVADEDMASNEDETIIKVQPGAQFPQETTPPPFNAAELEWLGFQFVKLNEVTGVSHQAMTSQKESGVTAGIAIQTLNDMQTERFGTKSRGFETAFVGLGRQIVWCAREAGSMTVSLPGLTRMQTYEFKDADIPDESFHIQVAPVSSMPNDPAGRFDLTYAMFNAGVISSEAFKRLQSMPDVEFELARENSEREYLEQLADRYIDADESELDDVYEKPEGYIVNKAAALLMFAQIYFEQKRDECPEPNLQLLRDYMNELEALLERAVIMNAPPAANEAMAGAPAVDPAMAAGAPGGPLAPAAVGAAAPVNPAAPIAA